MMYGLLISGSLGVNGGVIEVPANRVGLGEVAVDGYLGT